MTSGRRIERLLNAALLDPGKKREFYQAFLEAEVLLQGRVLGPAKVNAWGAAVFEEGRSLSLKFYEMEGQPVLPLYTSLKLLQKSLGEDAGYYIQIAFSTLLRILEEDVTVVVNPQSLESLELGPEQLKALRDGSLLQALSVQAEREPGSYYFKAPAQTPAGLVKALAKFLASCQAVRAAYLAQRLGAGRPGQRHWVVGLQFWSGQAQAETLFEELALDLNLVAEDHLGAQDSIEFVVLGGGELARYMLEKLKPFHQKRKQNVLVPGTSALLHSDKAGEGQAALGLQAPQGLAPGLLEAFRGYFRRSGAVAEARLACFENQPAHLVLGLVPGPFKGQLRKQAVAVLESLFAQHARPGQSLDIFFLGADALSQQVKRVRPFFSRPLAAWLQRWLA